jgi:RNA polymerase sigma factor (sigma-70 family)
VTLTARKCVRRREEPNRQSDVRWKGPKGYVVAYTTHAAGRSSTMTDQKFTDADLASLMRATQAGDAAAYLELLQIVTPYIRRVVAHRRGFAGQEEVEDLVQEVLLSLHAARATYDPQRPFTSWLMAIVRYRLADGARRYARTAAHEVPVDDGEVTFSDPSTNRDRGLRGDVFALTHAIQALPPGQRHAIELLKLQGMSLKEAAAATGSTVGALRVATHRAVATLRRRLMGKTQS